MPVERPDPPRRFVDAVPVGDLTPHPQNARKGDTGAIGRSIKANGFANVVVARESDGVIIIGEHRWRAAQASGRNTIPVIFFDVDEDWAMDIRLADNAAADAGTYDEALLHSVLVAIQATNPERLDATLYGADDLDFLATSVAALNQDAPNREAQAMLTQFLPPPAPPVQGMPAPAPSVPESGLPQGSGGPAPDPLTQTYVNPQERADPASYPPSPVGTTTPVPPPMDPSEAPVVLNIVTTQGKRDSIMGKLNAIRQMQPGISIGDALCVALGIE